MRTNRVKVAGVTWLVLLLGLVVTSSVAQAAGEEIPWATIDAGGGTSTGGGYSLTGTLDQFDAGTLSGGGYTLTGGFWTGVVTPTSTPTATPTPTPSATPTPDLWKIYLPLVGGGANH